MMKVRNTRATCSSRAAPVSSLDPPDLAQGQAWSRNPRTIYEQSVIEGNLVCLPVLPVVCCSHCVMRQADSSASHSDLRLTLLLSLGAPALSHTYLRGCASVCLPLWVTECLGVCRFRI